MVVLLHFETNGDSFYVEMIYFVSSVTYLNTRMSPSGFNVRVLFFYRILMASPSIISSLNKSRTPDVNKPIRLQLDPVRLHEPARTKLSTIESQRIMLVFDDLVQKMELIEILPIVNANENLFQKLIDR